MPKLKYSEIKATRESMYRKQKGVCLLCGHKIVADYAVLDHCHHTGFVRAVIHSDCNILLGKVENYTSRNGKRMQTEKRVEGALENMYAYMSADYTDNPLHPKHMTANDKLRRKYTRIRSKSKRAETKAKYTKLIGELL